MPSYSELIDAIMFADASIYVDGGAFYDHERDVIYLKGTDLEEEQAKIPEDVDWQACTQIPGEKSLDLGRALVESFVKEYRPDDIYKVRGFFTRRGAYRRFRFWTDELGLTDIWFTYRNRAEREAVVNWCNENNVPLTDIPELPEVPELPDPCGPPPTLRFPLPGNDRRIAFIANTVKNPNIDIGDYTYSEETSGAPFEDRVINLSNENGNRLVIGRFTAIGRKVRFIMNTTSPVASEDHLTRYPFALFAQGWEAATPVDEDPEPLPDTIVGNDVTIGFESVIMPGIKIGNGAIIEPRAVVTADVAPYTVVAGSPAVELRRRFSDKIVKALEEIAWWDWDAEKITRNLKAITSTDVKALEKAK